MGLGWLPRTAPRNTPSGSSTKSEIKVKFGPFLLCVFICTHHDCGCVWRSEGDLRQLSLGHCLPFVFSFFF